MRTIAASLGVSVATLQRWRRASVRRPRFRPIAIVAPALSAKTGAAAVIQITAAGPRVEGLTVETAVERPSTYRWTPLIRSVTYAADATLTVHFRSGAVYRYFAVPRRMFEAFLAAASKGSYFNHYIRGGFSYRRMDES